MDKIKLKVDDWKSSNIQVFWGEIAPSDHSVQIYDNEKYFFDTLEGFAGSGFLAGDSVVIIATARLISILDERLKKQGFDLADLRAHGNYKTLDAEETLSKFMVNDWPDESLFNEVILKTINEARATNRKVRAFGEMVALLWDQGYHGATIQLEHLWHQLHSKDSFTLYCAYPKSGFTQSVGDSISSICKCHSKIIDGTQRPSTEIYYRSEVL